MSHIKNGIWIAMPALACLITAYLFFFARGQNPASGGGHLKLAWQTLGFPLASPLLAGFSVDDLSHGLLFPSNTPIFSHSNAVIIIVISAIVSLLVIFAIIRLVPNNDYKLLILVFYAVSVAFFSYAYLQQMPISYEARHYRVIGIIVIPGILYLIGRLPIGYKALFGLMWLGMAWSSFHYLAKGYRLNETRNARGISGFAQQFIDWPSLHYVMTLDNKYHDKNIIFAFVSNDIGLEIKHSRIISLEPIDDVNDVNPEDHEYDGHAGPLYILLPVSYEGKKAESILSFFPGYTNFTAKKLSDQYILYSAK